MRTDPPQPTTGEYPLAALTPSYIRDFVNQAGYKNVTRNDPPTYDPNRPIKVWDDIRKFPNPTQLVGYETATLDPTKQFPITVWVQMSWADAMAVNIPPDSGPIPPSTAGTYVVPIRSLLPNERLLAHEGGVIDVINTDLFDPDPMVTAIHLLKRIAVKLGA